jgi:hypothetical protein
MKKEMAWLELFHVYIFHEKTKAFHWMIAAKNKSECMRKTIEALAFYYPDLKARDYMITARQDEVQVLL